MTGPFLILALTGLAGAILASRMPRIWLGLILVAALAILSCAAQILTGDPTWMWQGAFTIGSEYPRFLIDPVSALFLVPVGVVGSLSAIYSHEYWSDRQYPHSSTKGRAWMATLLFSMILVLSLANGLLFLLAWEIFALSAYFLITLDKAQRSVRAAGWLYLAASHTGTVALFAFFASLAASTGSWELGPMTDRTALAPLFWLALFGFGIKAGMFPLHIWLPSAHANAPSHVSAMMSAVAIKMGVYGIVRYSSWIPLPDNAGWIILALGGVSALLGIAFALAQNDIKRLLAYCSVENIGIILTGLGLSILAAGHNETHWGRIALAGVFLHIWNHAFFKALLFFGAGSVLHATGTRDMSRLGGLWRTLPWTTALFALGCLAVAGLPPLNGFVSEWIIYLGFVHAAAAKTEISGPIIPAIIALAGAGALALAAFAKAVTIIFLGAPRTKAATTAHECGWIMRLPMTVLAGIILGIGLFPQFTLHHVLNAVGTWRMDWAGDPSIPVASLGQLNIGLAILLLIGAVIILTTCRNTVRSGSTWDCGYARPTAHMQYTSGSFAGIVTAWFAWIVQPERSMRRVRGHFPDDARQLERIPETVLDTIVQPLSRGILFLADAAKTMQHGRLHLYILYVFVGASVLGVLAFWGGK